MKKLKFFLAILLLVWACAQKPKNHEPDMVEASPLSQMMRSMESFSERAKLALLRGESFSVPSEIWDFPELDATRGESKEDLFQSLALPYLRALEGMQRSDSQAYYYQMSIDACKNCHSYYCAGPLVAIQQLDLPSD